MNAPNNVSVTNIFHHSLIHFHALSNNEKLLSRCFIMLPFPIKIVRNGAYQYPLCALILIAPMAMLNR